MITLLVRGVPYTGFISASVTRSLSALSDYFTFTASAVNGFPPVAEGDPVRVSVDGVPVLTGFVDTVTGTEGEGAHTMTYSGRDRTCDLVDSYIGNMPELIPSDALTLKAVIEAVIAHIGGSLRVVDEFNPPPFNLAEDKIKPTVGGGAFDFISQWATKRQALLTSNAAGDIVITQASAADSGAELRRGVFLEQSWVRNATQLYNAYYARGQGSPAALDFSGDYSTADVAGQSGEYFDNTVRRGRQFVRRTSGPYSDQQLGARAKWESQLARARATTYTCTVAGHSYNGTPWAPNTLALVVSEGADIQRKMLIDTVTYAMSEGARSVTTLALVERDVYTINDAILQQRPVGGMNDAFKQLV